VFSIRTWWLLSAVSISADEYVQCESQNHFTTRCAVKNNWIGDTYPNFITVTKCNCRFATWFPPGKEATYKSCLFHAVPHRAAWSGEHVDTIMYTAFQKAFDKMDYTLLRLKKRLTEVIQKFFNLIYVRKDKTWNMKTWGLLPFLVSLGYREAWIWVLFSSSSPI